ncbi:hypothetical protein CP533_6535 [Ophiocordyceps camponoti-saundersi (nom. inval.)]|nr:hypothetical protein CP533_6535 [Ophiocordyceps camponoti-saundersi (nom. inval.)]
MSSAPSRGFAIIPGDQLKLLNRKDSWVVDFGSRAHAHVPEHVLETAEQAYKSKKSNLIGHYTACSAQPRISSPPEQDDAAEQATALGTDHFESGQIPFTPSSSMPICSSWPDTPKRPSYVESSIVRETPKTAKSGRQPQSQKRSGLGEVTGSSDVEDWEVSLPRARADADAPVNRVAARPSAEATLSPAVDNSLSYTQPPDVVAVSPEAITSNLTSAKKEGRRGRHRSIKFSSSPADRTNMGPIRMPSTKVFADGSSSSCCSSSSSVPPIAPLSLTAVHDVAETNKTSPRSVAVRRPAADRVTRISPPPPTPTPDHENSSPQVTLPSSTGESERARQSPTPCVAFLTAYPDYVTAHSGSLQNFVKSCVCLSYLQERRLLREYLFDDFVRFFSGEYLGYVARAGPGQEPLPAVEWFNLQSGAPLYTRMVLSGQNLEGVFAAYPEETRVARSFIEDRPTQNLQSPPPPLPETDNVPLSEGNVVPTQWAEDALVPPLSASSSLQPLTIRQYQLIKKRQLDNAKGFRDAAKKKKEAMKVKES